jgi:acyl-CoA synthetase (AMP-forming)/AMP-acid ligase II
VNIVRPILRHAWTQPDRSALVRGERTISYRELGDLVMRTAGRLAALGLTPGDRLGVCLKDSWEHVVAVLAAGHMGVTVVPIDWHAKPAERARILDGLGARATLVEPGAAIPSQGTVIPVDQAWHDAVARATPVEQPYDDWNAIYVISSTSGTTGAPKFIAMTHLQEYFSLIALLEPVPLPARCRYLSVSPLYFGAGRRTCHAHLVRGDTVILHPTMITAAEYASLVRRHKITVGFVVPTIVRQLLQMSEGATPVLPGVEALISGGAPLFGEEKRAAARAITPNFYERYGTAATGGIATICPTDLAEHADSVGRPHLFLDLQIVDDDDRPVPAGTAGRLRLRGSSLGAGLAGPAGAAAAQEGYRDGWYYPGELAALDAANYLYLKGRASDVIIRGGAKVYPGEIEAVLQGHDAVAEAAVVGQRGADNEEAVVAYVTLRRPVAVDELATLCRQRLTAYRVPRDIHVVDSLPRNPAGKVDKLALARGGAAGKSEGSTQ